MMHATPETQGGEDLEGKLREICARAGDSSSLESGEHCFRRPKLGSGTDLMR
jgi:hypothetical protein